MFHFTVPEAKKIRLILVSDAKNEADDQFAVVHALLTQRFDLRGIVASHFGADRSEHSMEDSYQEILKLLELTGFSGKVKVLHGATHELRAGNLPIASEGAKFIIDEAARTDDSRPLFIACFGALTDLASALRMDPGIAAKVNCLWVGGGAYPDGGGESTLMRDLRAANVVFASMAPFWQIPRPAYMNMRVGLAELERKVKPCGGVGNYLFEQIIALNDAYAGVPEWPRGEVWHLAASAAIGLLLDEQGFDFDSVHAPIFAMDGTHIYPNPANRKIRVYNRIDSRFVLEDFFAKLAIAAQA